MEPPRVGGVVLCCPEQDHFPVLGRLSTGVDARNGNGGSAGLFCWLQIYCLKAPSSELQWKAGEGLKMQGVVRRRSEGRDRSSMGCAPCVIRGPWHPVRLRVTLLYSVAAPAKLQPSLVQARESVEKLWPDAALQRLRSEDA